MSIFPTRSPESQGISSNAVLNFIHAVDQNIHDMHSFILLRHGQLVAQGHWAPYDPQLPHMLFSLSKSFTSTAIGLAAAEGRLSIDDPVISFFPDDLPAKISRNLAAMRVRHLLSMSSGHAQDTTRHITQRKDNHWVKGFLAMPVRYRPGSHFVYNSGATYMLSAILQKVTGQTLLEYLQPRLFDPLGFAAPSWESCPRGINTGGWGLALRTEEIARFGQLYLQKGQWQGKTLIPAEWVETATAWQVANAGTNPNPDWQQGYGFQFWRCQHGAYRGDGAFGQYCVVLPEQDAVLAITSGLDNMQAVLTLVWEHLLPGMQPAALAEDPAAQAQLAAGLAELARPAPRGAASSPLAAQIAGRTYRFDSNPMRIQQASFQFSAGGCQLTVKDQRGLHVLDCGPAEWRLQRTSLIRRGPFSPIREESAAASFVWLGEDTLQITARLLETPNVHTLTCVFSGEQVQISAEVNHTFSPAGVSRPSIASGRLTGKQ